MNKKWKIITITVLFVGGLGFLFYQQANNVASVVSCEGKERKECALVFLNDNKLGRTDVKAFFKVGIAFPSLYELYRNQSNSDIVRVIEKNCPQNFYTKNDSSFAEHYITIYDPDITSNKYKQRAVVYFDSETNIICAWKYEKDDFFAMKEKVTPIR